MPIPKIIHQIWFQGCDKTPDKFTKNIESVKKHSDGWTYKCWSEDDLYKQCQKFSSKCAQAFKDYEYMHQKIDLAKYAILYNIGGIYIDIDCEILKPLDTIPGLEDKDLIVCYTPGNSVENMCVTASLHDKIINNGVILSSKQNKYMKSLIEGTVKETCKNQSNPMYKNKQFCILRTTGPLNFTKQIMKFKNDKNVLILNYDFFEPCYSLDMFCKVTKNTIINHKHEQSWVHNYMLNFISCYFYVKNYIIFFLLVIVILYISSKS